MLKPARGPGRVTFEERFSRSGVGRVSIVRDRSSRAVRLGSVGLLLALGVCGSLGACGSSGSPALESSSTGPPEPAPAPPDSAASPEADEPAEPGEPGRSGVPNGPIKVLPDLVGKGLQVAQNRAQAAGFYRLSSHDALGRSRVQVLDRQWKVCFQSPPSGRQSVTVRVNFGTVKLDERCPGTDRRAEPTRKAGRSMPALRGKSAAAAIAALGLDASITWRDGTGEDRTVLLPTNWRICSQVPKPGARYDGVPVTLTVVKYGEKC